MCSWPVEPTVGEGRAAGEEGGGGDMGRRPAAARGGEGCHEPPASVEEFKARSTRAPISLLISNCSLLVKRRSLLYIFFSS